MISNYLDRLPLVAILRGITPEEVVPVGEALVSAGFAMLEIPLNSPRPYESIRRLHASFGAATLLGAGTVTDVAQVAQVEDAGGTLIVMPHGDAAVIGAAKRAGMHCIPGVSTPTEGFAALAKGADALKLFPAELLTATVLKAWRAVFPRETRFLPVGGITPGAMREYVAAGASGFGLGSALYKPGDHADTVATSAAAFVDAWKALQAQSPTTGER